MKKPQPQTVQLLGETESRGGVRSAVKQIWDYLRSFSESDFRFKDELYQELTPRYAQARYAPSVLANGDEAVVALTVLGSLPGYSVEATYDKDLQGVQLTASVDALDTVHVLFQNDTGGSVTLAAGKIRVYVWARPLSDEDSPFASESIIGGGGGGGGSYTDEQAQDAVGNILVDTNSIDFTYLDGTPAITADVKKQNSATIDLSIDASGLKAVLKDTAVTPGSYASANIVVDQQGRITAAAAGTGSGLTLVEHKLFTADATTYTFSGLDGNTDGNYLLICDLINNHGGAANYSIQWNGATTNQQSHLRWFSYAGGDTSGSVGGAQSVIGFSVANGTTGHLEIKISARKNPNGINRPLSYSGTGITVGAGATYSWVTGGYHNEFTNLTSLVLFSDQSDGLGNGSEATLWRLPQ